MPSKYPKEVHEFIANNVKGRTVRELVELVNQEYDYNFTESKMRSYKKNHRLHSGISRGHNKGRSKVFTEEEQEFIEKNIKGRKRTELHQLFEKEFREIDPKKITYFIKNHGLTSGVDSRIKPGNIPHNKGKKGYHAPGSEKGWFKKGGYPPNKRSVGSRRIDTDGYVLEKMAEPNKWKAVHKMLWEKEYGPIPKGMCVIFKDSNKENLELDNLALVTRAENLLLNQNKLRSENKEQTESGIAIARLKSTINQIKKNSNRNGGKDESI